jgi:hypothetical protein
LPGDRFVACRGKPMNDSAAVKIRRDGELIGAGR